MAVRGDGEHFGSLDKAIQANLGPANYKPGPGTHEGSSESTKAARPEMVAGAGVKPADHIEPGAKRDAPPLSGHRALYAGAQRSAYRNSSIPGIQSGCR